MSYKVAIDQTTEGVLHLPLPARQLDSMLYGTSGLGIAPNDAQAVLDGKLRVLSNLGHYIGPVAFTVIDGTPYTPPYAAERAAELLAGMDYTLLAARSDPDAWGLAPLYELDFRAPEPAHATSHAEITADAITQTSLHLTITPSSDVKAYYFHFLPTDEADRILGAEGEDGLRQTTLVMGTRMAAAGEGDLTELKPDTGYTVLCVVLDANGDQALIRREFTTAAAVLVRLTLAVEGFTTDRNPGFFAYNTVFSIVRTTDAVALNSCVLTRTQADALLAGGADYRDLARSETSVSWPAEDVAVANMEEGCTSVSENCLPKTTYVIVVLATDVNGGERLEHTDVTTAAEPVVPPPVTSELFEKLPGMWSAEMTVRSPKGTDEPQTFSLQIAAGVDEATSADYRSRNRLVCLGFGSLHYYSPEEMMEDYYYQAHPDEVRTDYGPKWFLQIAETTW